MDNIDKLINFDSLPVVTGPSIEKINYFFTTRQGGYSSGPFDSLNLGFSTADHDIKTQKNRDRLNQNLPSPLLWLKQVHGKDVIIVNEKISNKKQLNRPSADAVVTNVPGQVLSIQTADCLPVVIAHEKGLCLGMAHAGWRGLLEGVLENTVQTLVNEYSVKPSNLVAWIGPCIHQESFQVGLDVMQQFVHVDKSYMQFFKPDNSNIENDEKWLLDLPALACYKLSALDLKKVYISDYCTYVNDKLFYSYRRSNNTGRQTALAWISV